MFRRPIFVLLTWPKNVLTRLGHSSSNTRPPPLHPTLYFASAYFQHRRLHPSQRLSSAMEKKQATTGVVSGDLTKETASDNDASASASHKRKREATDILVDLDTDKMVDDDIFPDLDTDKMVDDDILPDLDADKMVDDDILPDLDADTDNMEDLDKIVELDKIKILDLMHHYSWAKSPESGAYAMGAWGPGLWSSSSASMPFTVRYIDTWCRGYSKDDCFLCVTGENGGTFKNADEAIIYASLQPGSTMILESKYNVMMFLRSPSSLLFCMNSGEDLRAFGKRTHWSVANVGAEFISEEYFEKKKVQSSMQRLWVWRKKRTRQKRFMFRFQHITRTATLMFKMLASSKIVITSVILFFLDFGRTFKIILKHIDL